MNKYRSDSVCVERLLSDYKKHGKIIVAYDFDNTVFDYHGNGLDCDDIISLLKELKDYATLICYTANSDEFLVAEYLIENDIPCDFLNYSQVPSNPKKIYYNILLDDRAGLGQSFNQLQQFLEQVK